MANQALKQVNGKCTQSFKTIPNIIFQNMLPAGLSLRFQVAGDMKLVAGGTKRQAGGGGGGV